jgi:hypothetical protein
MARPTEQLLRKELVNSKFSFLGNGIIKLSEIYELTKVQFGHLCDDNYLCLENCKGGKNSPEWNHVVRGSLDSLKSRNTGITKGANRGEWLFTQRI